MQDSRIVRRYAQAVFGAAAQYDVIAAVEDDLNGIVGLLEADSKFRHFLLAPYTSREEKAKVLDRLFSDRVTALTMQLLRVMLEKGREAEITGVRDEFVLLRRERERILYAVVTSAEPLDDDQRKRLIAKLSSVMNKKVDGEFHVEPNLVGGVKVAFESYVLDGTVRETLSKLRDRLRHDLLKQGAQGTGSE